MVSSEYCMGCGLCAAECPKQAITFTDKDGFISPVVDSTICVNCGKCIKVCKKDLAVQENHAVKAFAAWSKNGHSRRKSASGGVGFEIAKYLVPKGYAYLGIAMDESMQKAVAYFTSDPSQLEKSRGSKYIPTHMYPAIGQLKENDRVVIMDVPCHIGAYDSYLKQHGMRDRAILVDMFCAGPCNSLVLKKNLAELCQANQKAIDEIEMVKFRSKTHFGWSANLEICYQDGTVVRQEGKESDFLKLFYTDALHPECCYRCEYDKNRSFADIRIGDYWGRKYKGNKEGVSAVLAFTDAGKSLIEEMSRANILHVEQTSSEDIFEAQLDKPQRKTRYYKKAIAALQTDKSLKEIEECVMKPIFFSRRVRMKIRRTLDATNIGVFGRIGKKIKK